jgi:hypothetical protein
MDGHPADGPILPSQRPKESEQVLQGLPELERSVGQEAVVRQGDPKPAAYPTKEKECPESFPAEEEQGQDGPYMHGAEHKDAFPLESGRL